MSKKKWKRSHDLAFIALHDFHRLKESCAIKGIEYSVMMPLTHPETWTGGDISYGDFVSELNEIAVKLYCPSISIPEAIKHQPVSGGEAFGIIHYCVEKALVSVHSVKGIQDVVGLVKDFQAVLHRHWAYSDDHKVSVKMIASRYQWAAFMGYQQNDSKRPKLEFSPKKIESFTKTASAIMRKYSDLNSLFCEVLSESHALKLGGEYGDRLAKRENITLG